MEQLRIGKGQCVCPVAGCGVQLTKKDLKENKELARQIRRNQDYGARD